MIVYQYDQSFEGLLSCVFDAFTLRRFPDKLISLYEPEPLFTEFNHPVISSREKRDRVWKALEKKVDRNTLNMISYAWLSELPGADETIFRYLRKTFESQHSIVTNFADDDVLKLRQIAQKVSKEKHRMIEFVRFQKTADEIYFAPIDPDHNVIPLIVTHFRNRFADQEWIIYDTRRNYGMHHHDRKLTEVRFENNDLFPGGKVAEQLLAENELIYRQLWKKYFKAITINERINLKLHRQHLPRRYWKYLTEKER